MSFEREILDMMPATITYQAYSAISTDGYGTPSWSATSKSVKARIQIRRSDIRSVSGRDLTTASGRMSTYKLIMAPYSTAGTSDTVTVTPLDKITLPAGFLVSGSSAPPIVAAYPAQDEDGLHHNEVWL